MRLVSCICVLMVGLPCVLAMSARPSAKSVHKADVLTVFLTGDELGALQPCGCSGGQLGGLDRRSAILAGVPASRRLIVDTGSLVEGDGEQDLIKFDIIVQAFDLLNYDLVNLTEKDVEIAQNLGLLSNPPVRFISAGRPVSKVSAKAAKQFVLQGKPVAVTVATIDTKSGSIEQAGKLFSPRSGRQTVNILIVNRCDSGIIDSIAKMGIVDCLVCPAESDEAMVIGNPKKRPLIVSVGRFGKYVGKLQITLAKASDRPILSFSAVAVTENLPQEKSLVELYRVYQQLVKEANLLENWPRFTLPNGLEYVGSKSCKLCHDYAYEKWSGTAHAHGLATLEMVGSNFDPECVRCHVVGMKYESGFVSAETGSYLKDVGCENCHGPGSKHIRTFGRTKIAEPISDCIDCHSPEQSSDYAGNEQIYLKKIIHWREPNTPADVKEKRD